MIPGTCISALPISAGPAFVPSLGSQRLVRPPPQAPFVVPAGIILTRQIEDALYAAFAAGGAKPLTASQVLLITGPAPPLLTDLPCDGAVDEVQAAYGFDLEAAV